MAKKVSLAPRRNLMDIDDRRSNPNRQITEDRRSGNDTRSDSEKQLIGERRFGAERRNETKAIQGPLKPSNEQLALFARRLRRALSGERARDFFGVARGEYDFAIYPEVLRTVEWIEDLIKLGGEESAQPASPSKITLRKTFSSNET